MPLPWETGSFLPYMVGQYFVGPDGSTMQIYPDPASPSGYTLKKIDKSGAVSYQIGPSPNDPAAASRWFKETPEGQALAAAQKGLAEQNKWNRNQQEGALDLQREQLAEQKRQAMVNAKSQEERDRVEAWYKGQLVQNARAQLGLQTLQLGASLRGPRDWLAYQEAAGGARANPYLNQGVASWADASSNRMTGQGSWNGGAPQRMDLNALAGDFGGGGGGGGNDYPGGANWFTGGGVNKNDTVGALNSIAMNPHKAHTGWWSSLNPSQQQMAIGAWEKSGHDPDTVLARLAAGRVSQGIRGSRYA